MIRADFFFWHLGTPLQRSQVGLLKSLLRKILEQRRDIIKTAFPELWEDLGKKNILQIHTLTDSWYPWTLAE